MANNNNNNNNNNNDNNNNKNNNWRRKVTKVANCFIDCNSLIELAPTLWVDDQIKAKLSYASGVACQGPGHSKCDQICDTNTTIRQGKVLIFKSKAFSFYTTGISHINISL